mgnify:CR=1 FL=1
MTPSKNANIEFNCFSFKLLGGDVLKKMRYLIAVILPKLIKRVPEPVKNVAKRMGLNRIYDMFFDKYSSELTFQTRWAKAYNGKSGQLEKDLLSFWKQYRCLDKITESCDIGDNSLVLDVGCGIATVLHILKGKRFGIDPLAEEYLKMYKYPAGITVVKGGGEKIPFPDKYFDFVFCSNVLDHVSVPSSTVGEIHRVLRCGGSFILVVEVFGGSVIRDPAHPHSLTRKDVKMLVAEGFEVVHEELVPWHSDIPGEEGFVAVLRKV